MNLPSILILIAVIGALACAVIGIVCGRTGGCGGDCAHCSMNCKKRENEK